ncbi:MAG: PaaI family thioesterase [Acidimicrobiia bacterium]|nr:PaaI family thioesterase [Acidimicrobiia bacterium]
MSERAEEIRRVADALRDVIERFVATSAPLEVFDGIADDLRAVAAKLDGYPQDHLFFGFPEASTAGEVGDTEGPFDNSPLMGRANPLAPPLKLTVEADRVVGTVRFGSAYEGPPGHVHGGFVAAAFDELLGLTQALGGSPGMTGRLIVHYRRPTPLRTELHLEGTVERVDGRKRFCIGKLWADGVLCAEAEGLFVTVDFEKISDLHRRREEARSALPD